MSKLKRNADGRLPIEAIKGKAVRGLRIITGARSPKLVALDSRGRVIFKVNLYELADESGMFFHYDETETGELA